MKLSVLTVVSTTLFAALGTTSPVNFECDSMISENYPGTENSTMEITSSSSVYQLYEEMRSILGQLKGYVHDTHIDVSSFAAEEKEIRSRISNLSQITKFAHLGSIEDDAESALSLFDAIGKSKQLSDRFDRCYYWGSDLVEEMDKIYIRLLALTPLNVDKVTADLLPKLDQLDKRAIFLKYRADIDPEFTGAMKNAFLARAGYIDGTIKTLETRAKDAGFVHEYEICETIENVFV